MKIELGYLEITQIIFALREEAAKFEKQGMHNSAYARIQIIARLQKIMEQNP